MPLLLDVWKSLTREGAEAGYDEIVRTRLIGVLDGELGPLAGYIVVAEDRLDRADWLAGARADAFVGVDGEHPLAVAEALDRAPARTAASRSTGSATWTGRLATTADTRFS